MFWFKLNRPSSLKTKVIALAVLTLGGLASQTANAFPEMVRHGYVNCMTCHVSPNGGGILTPYGRGLSGEALSTWSTETEGQFLYVVNPPNWLSFGGDFRAIQTLRDTPEFKEGRFIFMQADLEAAAGTENLKAVASFGRQEIFKPHQFSDEFISRRHYAMYRPTAETAIRAGRYFFSYGLNTPDHTQVTKRGLGWDEGTETYNLEASWITPKVDAFVTGVFGRPDNTLLNRDSGIALRSSYTFKERYKLGASYFYGSNNKLTRHLVGPYAILGFTPKFFALAEFDFQFGNLKTTGNDTTGIANYLRLDYEIVKGFHAFVTQELSKLDFASDASVVNNYSVGLQFFPRPHFEFTLQYQKTRMLAANNDYTDFGWIMGHFYP